jgi:2-polyprenyl-6-methoxyphenol hydroxylase-like FAD-dependent oxidoreductase
VEKRQFDAIVVGARIAGSAIAYQLAQRGWKIALVERSKRPLGTTLSVPISMPRALVRFRDLGLFPAIEQVAPRLQPIRSMHMQLADDLIIKGPLPEMSGFDYGFILRRELFDDVLLGYVLDQAPGIRFFEGATVVELLRDGEQITGVQMQQLDETEHQAVRQENLQAPLVIGADGRFSIVARLVGAKDYNVRASYTTLYYSYCEGIDLTGLGEIAFVPSDNHRLVVFSHTGEGVQVISAFFPVAQYRQFQDQPAAELRATWERAPLLRGRLDQLRLRGKVMGLAPQPGYFRPAGGPGWALVGDAAHFKDPASGQGFHDALFTVEQTLEALDTISDGNPLTPQAAGQTWPGVATLMQQARDKALQPMYAFTYQFGESLTRAPTRLERALLRTIARDPKVTRQFFGITSGATDVRAFNRAAPLYLLRGLLSA